MWVGNQGYKCGCEMIGYPSTHICNRPALVEYWTTGNYFCRECYEYLLKCPNVSIYPSLDFIESCGTVKIPFRGTPVAKCPDCNQDSLHPFKSKNDRSIIAKCNKCGYYRYRKVKITQEEYRKLIKNIMARGLTLEKIAEVTGEPLERLQDAVRDQTI
jgi:Zn ribbon nucleic-acid-binding protein